MEFEKRKKEIAIGLVVILVVGGLAGGLYALLKNMDLGEKNGFERGELTLDDLLNSQSSRISMSEGAVMVSMDEPSYALMGQPIACYYAGSEESIIPLLVNDKYTSSRAVSDVLSYLTYPDAYVIGDIGERTDVQITRQRTGADIEKLSLQVAKDHWSSTDGVILMTHDQVGYNGAVMVAPLASYLDIPVIVSDTGMDTALAEELSALGVRYTIVSGDTEGYGKVWHVTGNNCTDTFTPEFFSDIATERTLAVLEQRVGTSSEYIALANPLDIFKPTVQDEVSYFFDGDVTNSDAAAYPGAAPTSGGGNPIHYFKIPESYEFANVIIDLKLDVSQEKWGDLSGARAYTYFGVDGDEDGAIDGESDADKLIFFGGTPAYENIGYDPSATPLKANQWGHFHTEIPVFNERDADGNPYDSFAVEILGRLPTDWGNFRYIAEDGDYEAYYMLNITVQSLQAPTYPLMHQISCMSGYLAAHRHGTTLALPQFQLHDLGYIGCVGCGEPAYSEDTLLEANEQALYVRQSVNRLLARMAGQDGDVGDEAFLTTLADHYNTLSVDELPAIGIIADTNMVPMFYYNSTQGDATEGFGMPSDICYSDIDAQLDGSPKSIGGKDPVFDIPVGRVDGWDAQDVSALLVRTFFYSRIIERVNGPHNDKDLPSWKDSALTSVGMEPPVGAAISVMDKEAWAFRKAGFTVEDDELWKQDQCRRQRIGPYYESTNFISFCAHGFYYWYVPPAAEGMGPLLPPISAGGAFDVAHVKEMRFGPSVIFGSSCVTGRIDGLQAYNCLSLAFLHSGIGAYVGATRESWGSLLPGFGQGEAERLGNLLSMYMYGHLTGYLYNKDGGIISGFGPEDTTIGVALMLAKTDYVRSQGLDDAYVNCDTVEEFVIHGDPAFNPYEPNHEG